MSRSVRGRKRDAQRLLTELSNELALRLARYFGTSERFWLNLQSRYELEVERDRLAGTLDQIEPLAPRRAVSTASCFVRLRSPSAAGPRETEHSQPQELSTATVAAPA